jgi:hypothetical protein
MFRVPRLDDRASPTDGGQGTRLPQPAPSVPARYRIYPDVGFVHTEAYGRLTGAEMLAHAAALAADPAFSPSYAQLADFRAVTVFAAGPDDMRRLASSNPFDPDAKRVALVGTAIAYGMLRMYQMMTETEDSGSLVTRDEDAAWAHVGRGPEIASRPSPSTWASSGDGAEW